MSWAKIVKKYCSSNGIPCDGDNSECFVPTRKEPHLHCGKTFLKFTDVSHSHAEIAREKVQNSAQDVLASLEKGETDATKYMGRVVRHLVTNYQ